MVGWRFLVILSILMSLGIGASAEAAARSLGSDEFWTEVEEKYGGTFAALVVLDEKVSTYDDLNRAPYVKIHRIIAILDPVAGADYGEQRIIYFKGEKFRGLKARVQREGGKYKDIDPKHILKKPLGKGMKQLLITVPRLEARMLIELSYTLEGRFVVSHHFGAEIPVLSAKFKLEVPGASFDDWVGWQRTASITRPGSLKPTVTDEAAIGVGFGGVKVFVWELEDIPAFSEGELSPPAKDRMPFAALDVSRFYSWKDFAKDATKAFERKVKCTGRVKEVALEISSEAADPVARARAILEYIQREIDCEPGNFGFLPPQDSEKTLEDKRGDCTDVNALLTSMLRSVGIDAQPVLIRWRSNGSLDPRVVEPTGVEWQIAYISIGNRTYLLDGGHKLCPFGILPRQAEGTIGMLLDGDKSSFVRLPVSGCDDNALVRRTNLVLKEDGRLEGAVEEHRTGLKAYMARSFYKRSSESEIRTYCEKKFGTMVRNSILDHYSLGNLEEEQKPLVFSAQFSCDKYFIPGDDHLRLCLGELIDPVARPNLEKREQFASYRPEFSHRWSAKDWVTVTLPTGYVIEQLPEPTILETAYYRYSAFFNQPSSREIVFSRELSIKVRKPELEFDEVKAFLDEFSESDAQCVVAVKR